MLFRVPSNWLQAATAFPSPYAPTWGSSGSPARPSRVVAPAQPVPSSKVFPQMSKSVPFDCRQTAKAWPVPSMETWGCRADPASSFSMSSGVPQPELGSKTFAQMLSRVVSFCCQTATAFPFPSRAMLGNAASSESSDSTTTGHFHPVPGAYRLDQMLRWLPSAIVQTAMMTPPAFDATSGVTASDWL